MVLGLRLQLLTSGIVDLGYVASILDDSKLHAETYAEEGHIIGTRPCDGFDHSAGASHTKPAWHQN
jgi:hypothetical protein